MLHKFVLWVESYADHKYSKQALAAVAFTESSFFPIPPFVLIVAMLAHDKKPSWVKLAIIGTLSSVLGGIAAYFIGMFFYDYVGAPLVHFYGIEKEVASLGTMFKDHVVATILLASLSPIPYKVFTLSAGLFAVNIWSFIAASLVGRSIRFVVVSYLADRYGARAKNLLLEQQKYVTWFMVFLTLSVILYTLL